MSDESELIERIRELHKPVWLTAWHMVCEGCDDDSWESEMPEWPCRTALLVYTQAERDAVRPSPVSGGLTRNPQGMRSRNDVAT